MLVIIPPLPLKTRKFGSRARWWGVRGSGEELGDLLAGLYPTQGCARCVETPRGPSKPFPRDCCINRCTLGSRVCVTWKGSPPHLWNGRKNPNYFYLNLKVVVRINIYWFNEWRWGLAAARTWGVVPEHESLCLSWSSVSMVSRSLT